MSIVLSKPDVSRYTNAYHVEFHETSYGIFDRNKDVISVPELLTGYQTKVAQEDRIYKWLRRSEFTEKKAETDEALRKITNRVTSLIDLNGPLAYEPLVREFNVHVNHYNTLVHEHYGRLHAKTDISPGEVATIGEQPYTGKIVTTFNIVAIEK
jgi:hypothetical protein